MLEQDFESALAAIPSSYGEGVYEGLRYGVTVRKSRDGKRTSLFARALAGGDVVSFNLYRLRSGEDSLRPCEMPAEKVVAFVLGYVPDLPKARARLRGLVRRLRRCLRAKSGTRNIGGRVGAQPMTCRYRLHDQEI